MERIAYTVDEVLELVGIGRTKLYDIINAGDLPARKVGSKTIILAADLQAWLDGLPMANPGAAKEDRGGKSA